MQGKSRCRRLLPRGLEGLLRSTGNSGAQRGARGVSRWLQLVRRGVSGRVYLVVHVLMGQNGVATAVAPTGTVTVTFGTMTQTAALTPDSYQNEALSTAFVTLTNVPPAPTNCARATPRQQLECYELCLPRDDGLSGHHGRVDQHHAEPHSFERE